MREIAAKLDGLRELLLAKLDDTRQLGDERDRLYKERDESRRTAVDAALTAVKEQTKASFEASEKAIVKAEEAQKAYNTAHNDLSRKLDEQNKATMPRSETEARFTAMEEKISDLRESRSEGSGRALGGRTFADQSRANIGILLGFASLVIALIVLFLRVKGTP